jgi:hypothetical protein
MSNAKFWTEKGASVSPEIGSSPQEDTNMNDSFNKPKKGKKVWKGLGITGVVLLVIAGVVGFLSYKFVVKPSYAVIDAVNTLKVDASSIGAALSSRDLVALEEALSTTESDLENVRQERESSFSWARDIKTFKINEFYSDSDRFLNAGQYTVDALRETAVVVTPFADAAGLKVSGDLEIVEEGIAEEEEGLMEAFQSWISIMPEVAEQMDGVIDMVAKIGQELEPINVEKYPEEFKGFYLRDNIRFAKDTLSQAGEYAPDVKHALTVFPRMLGIGSPTDLRYMIIMQNDKELRPTGGFMTNYVTFKVNLSSLPPLSEFSSKDMYSIDESLDIIDATYDFPDAPEAYMKYLQVERWYARDMNASPDLVTSMDQFMEFYNMAGRIEPSVHKPIDGIFAIDTHVVRELLAVTGPVTVNGITYTEDNVVLELEKIASLELREQKYRKRVLGELMDNMLVNVFESDKNLWSKLIEKGVDLAVRKHVQLYLFDEEAQALAEKYGFGGRIEKDVEGDYATVISTNLGADKTNWFVTKVVDHSLEKEGNSWVRTVKINYTYDEPSSDYLPFIKRFRDWVRVYVPAGSQVISVEGSEDGTSSNFDEGLNKLHINGYLELGPGESKEIVFKYRLPASAVAADKYMLTIQKQAGIDREVHNVTVNGETKEIDLFKDTEVEFKL